MALDQIDRYLLRDYREGESNERPRVPPGAPIGAQQRTATYQAVLSGWQTEEQCLVASW